MNVKVLLFGAFIVGLFWFIRKERVPPDPVIWKTTIPSIGSSSSPRAVDLNNDGVLDIVMGGGGREYTSTDFGVFALDGKDGSMLWSVPARNQVIGSPVFLDINNDRHPDVIIGGRSATLYAINGLSGEILWEFLPLTVPIDIEGDTTLLNFYTPQFIPDQDGDGMEDLLVAFGGYMKAAPTQSERPSGSLIVVSSKDGRQLARAGMPDGKETYMSALVHDFEGNGELSVIFGSGGETIDGNFYKADLESVIRGDLSDALVLANGNGKGFIAPPVLVDLDHDGILDIVASSVNGEVFSFNGRDGGLIWRADLQEELEGYTMPAPGIMIQDSVPAFFVSFGHGRWPAVDFTRQLVLSGRDGSIVRKETLGNFQYASPIAADFNRDDFDDVLVVVNHINSLSGAHATIPYYTNSLYLFDIKNNRMVEWMGPRPGSNLGSTPLLIDLDDDGYLDLIYIYMNDPWNFYSFNEATVERITTGIRDGKRVGWGGYMGNGWNGIYRQGGDRAGWQ